MEKNRNSAKREPHILCSPSPCNAKWAAVPCTDNSLFPKKHPGQEAAPLDMPRSKLFFTSFCFMPDTLSMISSLL